MLKDSFLLHYIVLHAPYNNMYDFKHTYSCLASEIVTISSSEDDVVMVGSEGEQEEEDDDDDVDDDPNNSGSHVNDELNVPDVNGQVLVNVGHSTEEKDIFLAPQLAQAVKPHQVSVCVCVCVCVHQSVIY